MKYQNRFCCLLTLIIGTMSAHAQVPELPRNIEILRSKEAELKKIAELTRKNDSFSEFDYQGSRMRAEIATETCVWHGWNVPIGTILNVTIHPQRPQVIEGAELEKRGFVRVADDTFRQYYTDARTGVQYFLDAEGKLISVSYFPPEPHKQLRCLGFPAFNPTSRTYSLGDSPFTVDNFDEWNQLYLSDFGFRLKDSGELRGVVVVYFAKNEFDEAKAFQRRILDFLTKDMEVLPDRITVRLGGLRDKNMIETFLISPKQPDPEPRPKYSSPMVFGSAPVEPTRDS